MIALLLLGSCLFVGSATAVLYESECYGKQYSLPFDYRPPVFRGQLYFTPSTGGPKKLLLENSEAKDPRLDVSYASAKFFDRTERNGGTFSVSIDGSEFEVINLEVLDCAPKISGFYWLSTKTEVHGKVDLVEFTPFGDLDQLKVLWNVTDPGTHDRNRRRLRKNIWEMWDLTQADNGYYNFWAKDKYLTSIHLTIKEHTRNLKKYENEQIFLRNPVGRSAWTVNFIRDGESEENTLVLNGELFTRNWRFDFIDEGLYIYHVAVENSGRYEFRDSQGNLAATVNLEVNKIFPTTLHIGLIVGGVVVVLIICCCCVRKRCCKKSSSKRDESTPQPAEAPAVYYHDGNQGEGYARAPPPASSYQPVNSPVIGEPAATSTGPSPAAPGGTGDNPPSLYTSNFLSSDPEPTFELKGVTFLSAPPSSSDCDVYTSDKLNFL